MNGTRTLGRAALVCGCFGVIGWYFIFLIFRNTPGQDWMVFDTAAQAWRRGDIALLLDGARFTAVLNATHSWLAQPLDFHPWVYPPYTMLLALPFGLLPWAWNYAVFLALSFAGLMMALCLWRPAGRARALLIAGVVACPACAFTIGAGQNSFMSAGLVTAGVWFMHRRPQLAGLLLGLMVFKPQLALLLPVAVLAGGAWASIAYAAATVCVLMLASLVIPGPALWRGWLHLFLGGDPAFHHWVTAGRIYGQSVFACLRIAGAPAWLANAGQLAAIAVGAFCVWRVFRVPAPERQRLTVLLSAMVLAAPHIGDYDALLLGIACTLVLTEGFARSFGAWEAGLAVAAWVSTAFEPPFVFSFAVVTPLIVGAFVWRQARAKSWVDRAGPPRPPVIHWASSL